MEHYSKADIKCPYFLYFKKDILCCEGLIGNTCMTTRFDSMGNMSKHIKQFCKKEDGGKCPLALNLYDKYERLEKLSSEYDRKKEIYNRG